MSRILTLVVLMALFSACGSSPKEVRYYRVAPNSEPSAARGELVIGVEPFATDASYDAQKIVYRESPYRIDYYHYHRWAAPPGIMVADYVREELENSGRFSAVESGFTADAVAMVSGRIIQFEEVDVDANEWRARLKLNLTMRNAETGALVWSRVIVEEEPLKKQSPEGLAQAMSIALDRAVSSSLPQIEEQARAVAAARIIKN